MIPIVGYHCWQLAAAAVTGFIAKENVVGTLAVCFGISNLISTEDLVIAEGAEVSKIALAFGGETGVAMTAVAALAYLMLNLFSPPCFAAIGAMNSEMKSKKWLWGGIALQFAVGYTVGYLVYQIGTLITTGAFGAGVLPGFAAVVAIVGVILYMCADSEKKLKEETKVVLNKKPAGKM